VLHWVSEQLSAGAPGGGPRPAGGAAGARPAPNGRSSRDPCIGVLASTGPAMPGIIPALANSTQQQQPAGSVQPAGAALGAAAAPSSAAAAGQGPAAVSGGRQKKRGKRKQASKPSGVAALTAAAAVQRPAPTAPQAAAVEQQPAPAAAQPGAAAPAAGTSEGNAHQEVIQRKERQTRRASAGAVVGAAAQPYTQGQPAGGTGDAGVAAASDAEDVEDLFPWLLPGETAAPAAAAAEAAGHVAVGGAASNARHAVAAVAESAAAAAAAAAAAPSAAAHQRPAPGGDAEDEHPSDFVCPISCDLMSQPVILCGDGHSYERSCIEAWLARSQTSPMTGEALPADGGPVLVPNKALQNAIAAFVRQQQRQ